MRKAPGAVQPCCGEGDGPGAMRFIPPQNRVCFVGCRTCRVTHGMCAGTSSSNDAYAGVASPDAFQLAPSPPIFSLFQTYGSSLAGGRRAGMRKAYPAPYNRAPAKEATDPARCASYHPKRRVCPSYHVGMLVGCRTCFAQLALCCYQCTPSPRHLSQQRKSQVGPSAPVAWGSTRSDSPW